MFRLIVLFFVFLAGCSSISIPKDFMYKEINTDIFTLASWQKISNNNEPIKIYIEGDGASFDAYGRPTKDPTPKGRMIRELAFGDKSSNVVYLARPCQYIMSDVCSVRHWTTARFAPEVISSLHQAIKQIVGKRDVVLIGFSGGAQVAGLVASIKKDLKIRKIITIAGNLDHLSWTRYHNLPSLNESINLADYKNEYFKTPQKHFVGNNDRVIPPSLIYEFVEGNNIDIEIVEDASHSKGWESVYYKIWSEN